MPYAAGKRRSTEKFEILRMSEQCQDEDSCKTCQKKTSTVDKQLRVFRSHQGREARRIRALVGLDTEKEDRGIELEGTGAGLRWGKEERKIWTQNRPNVSSECIRKQQRKAPKWQWKWLVASDVRSIWQMDSPELAILPRFHTSKSGPRNLKMDLETGTKYRNGQNQQIQIGPIKDRTINILQNLQDQSRTQDGMGKTKTAQDTAPKTKDSAGDAPTARLEAELKSQNKMCSNGEGCAEAICVGDEGQEGRRRTTRTTRTMRVKA
ncbi:hypothetical protein B0H10DRAFT_1959340 [Mycena sp. CBHHK59/15]|nr:hypothetical protein B0H10DRAFT_1959340 [Mycena sp. CBHHK59/15]